MLGVRLEAAIRIGAFEDFAKPALTQLASVRSQGAGRRRTNNNAPAAGCSYAE